MFRILRRSALILPLAVVAFTGAGCDDDNPASPNGTTEHADLDGVVVQLADGTELVRQWEGTVTGELTATAGATLEDLRVWFLDENQDLVHPGEDHLGIVLARGEEHDHAEAEAYELEVEVGDDTVAAFTVHADYVVDMDGLVAGDTTVRFVVLHEGHADFTSLELPVRIAPAPAVR